MKLVIITLVFVAAVGTLLSISILHGSVPVYKVQELTEQTYQGEECRVEGGKIARIDQAVAPLKFAIESETGRMPVVKSDRSPPDNFKIGNSVSIRGYYDGEKKIFEANDVTTACPSKYEGESEEAGSSYGLESPTEPSVSTPPVSTPPVSTGPPES